MEKLARDYREALSENRTDLDAVQRIVRLEEAQLDYLNALLPRLQGLPRRTVNYLKNVIFRVLQRLNELVGNPAYVPAFRSVCVSSASALANVKNLQISVFVLLDESGLGYEKTAEILALETRKTALLGTL